MTTAPYGSWVSPITAELLVASAVGLGGPAYAGGDLWWSELRPSEAGRVQLVRKALAAAPDTARDVLPDGFAARTRVHEYGGGAWWLHTASDDPDEPGGDVTLFFANWADQRLYRIDHAGSDDAEEPVAITPEPDHKHGFRFADGVVTSDGRLTICVREWHGAPDATEARNEIVAIPTDGSAEPTVLVGVTIDLASGPDFVACPRLSPDGETLCWIQWSHPNMPWDSSELWTAGFDEGGWVATPALTGPARLAGGNGVSVIEPRWGDDGRLTYGTDERGFWSLYRPHDPGRPELDERRGTFGACDNGDCGQPQWVFGQSTYLPMRAERREGETVWSGESAVVYRIAGRDNLLVSPRPGRGSFGLDWVTAVDGLTFVRDSIAVLGSSFRSEPCIFTVHADGPDVVTTVDSDDDAQRQLRYEIHRPPRDLGVDAKAWFSVPEHIEFSTTPNRDGSPGVAYALFYPPKNPDFGAPDGELPPLIVMSHGGPTSAARPQLNLFVQFWTSRGFAVVDVNYRGSTGYGRAYREELNGAWGIVDVEDCIAAARHLAAEGLVDGARLAIRGGSAGGYTTLCALTFHDDFTVGTSLYGVADLEALAVDTHKFESRYLDALVGPYPDDLATYHERSPIHHVDRLDTPLLILQGLEDEVVPPEQAQMMADALAAKGVPYAYLAFEGEQHGFRQAANIRRAAEAELYFYGRMFGFDLADEVEPVEIHGEPS